MEKLVLKRGWKKRIINFWVGEGAFDSEQYPVTAVNQTINDLDDFIKV